MRRFFPVAAMAVLFLCPVFPAAWTVTASPDGTSRTYSLDERSWVVRVYNGSSGWQVPDDDSLFEFMASELSAYAFSERHYYAEKAFGPTEETETVLFYLRQVFGEDIVAGKDFFVSSINEYLDEDGTGVIIMEWMYSSPLGGSGTYIIFVPVEGIL